MEKIKVKILQPIAKMAEIKESIVEIEINNEINAKDLIDLLSNEYGRKLRDLILEPDANALQKGILFLLNGRLLGYMQGLHTIIKGGDIVALAIAFSGG